MSAREELAAELLLLCRSRGMTVATAESCTGGLVAAAITDLPGSSAAFDRGFVTYSNAAKTEMLGVEPSVLARFGAVSRETAEAMAVGALARSRAGAAVAITGIAGPGGGTADKPVGLVWFGIVSRRRLPRTMERHWHGMTREQVRLAAVEQALRLLIEALSPDQAGAGA